MGKKTKESGSNQIIRFKNQPGYVKAFKANDSSAIGISFDLHDAPKPERSYAAEFCTIKKSPNENFELVFSDYNEALGAPTHSVYVKFTDLSLINLWENSKAYVERTIKLTKELYSGYDFSAQKEMISPNIQTFDSNIASIGNKESDLLFHFYYLDPMLIAQINQQKTVSGQNWIEPRLTVTTSLRSAYRLLCGLKEHVNKILYLTDNLKRINEQKLLEG